MERKVYLDDIRTPSEAYHFIIVRNYDEFVKEVLENGVPSFVSFDHDLAEEHYTPTEYWDHYESSKAFQESKTYYEKTGKDCAKWLADYCMTNGKLFPNANIHSMNPVGADNIKSIVQQIQKIQKAGKTCSRHFYT